MLARFLESILIPLRYTSIYAIDPEYPNTYIKQRYFHAELTHIWIQGGFMDSRGVQLFVTSLQLPAGQC